MDLYELQRPSSIDKPVLARSRQEAAIQEARHHRRSTLPADHNAYHPGLESNLILARTPRPPCFCRDAAWPQEELGLAARDKPEHAPPSHPRILQWIAV